MHIREFCVALQGTMVDFVNSHGLGYCETMAHVHEQLHRINDLKPAGAVKSLSLDEMQIASVLIAGKLVFNAAIHENLDIAHFLFKLYTSEFKH